MMQVTGGRCRCRQLLLQKHAQRLACRRPRLARNNLGRGSRAFSCFQAGVGQTRLQVARLLLLPGCAAFPAVSQRHTPSVQGVPIDRSYYTRCQKDCQCHVQPTCTKAFSRVRTQQKHHTNVSGLPALSRQSRQDLLCKTACNGSVWQQVEAWADCFAQRSAHKTGFKDEPNRNRPSLQPAVPYKAPRVCKRSLRGSSGSWGWGRGEPRQNGVQTRDGQSDGAVRSHASMASSVPSVPDPQLQQSCINSCGGGTASGSGWHLCRPREV